MSSSHQSLSPAFLTAAPLSLSLSRAPASRCLGAHVPRAVPTRLSRRATLRMMADETPSDDATPTEAAGSQAEEGPTTSAKDILKTLRDDAAADMAAAEEDDDDRASRSMLGVYRDVDGRSNVWAVEPLEETDTAPQLSKTVIIAGAAIFIIVALLVLPLLPFTNPDQL